MALEETVVNEGTEANWTPSQCWPEVEERAVVVAEVVSETVLLRVAVVPVVEVGSSGKVLCLRPRRKSAVFSAHASLTRLASGGGKREAAATGG